MPPGKKPTKKKMPEKKPLQWITQKPKPRKTGKDIRSEIELRVNQGWGHQPNWKPIKPVAKKPKKPTKKPR